MERVNNYLLQVAQAKRRFLTYDQQKLIRKFRMKHDDDYFYVNFLCKPYRLSRTTGDLDRWEGGTWVDANTHEEVMTLLDLICDSRDDRSVSGIWTSAQNLGNMVHRGLLESADPLASRIDKNPEAFRRACAAMGGTALPGGDICYCVELFDGLPVGLQFWHSDEDFPAKLHIMWDENALQYLRYETTYYAVNLIRKRLAEGM